MPTRPCPTPDKRAYAHRGAAYESIRSQLRQDPDRRLQVYVCSCGAYHLTHKRTRPTRAPQSQRSALEHRTRRNLQAEAGQRAIERLTDAHRGEYLRLLAEEFTRAGLRLPYRIARRLEES